MNKSKVDFLCVHQKNKNGNKIFTLVCRPSRMKGKQVEIDNSIDKTIITLDSCILWLMLDDITSELQMAITIIYSYRVNAVFCINSKRLECQNEKSDQRPPSHQNQMKKEKKNSELFVVLAKVLSISVFDSHQEKNVFVCFVYCLLIWNAHTKQRKK